MATELAEIGNQWKNELKADIKTELKNELQRELRNEIKDDIQVEMQQPDDEENPNPWRTVQQNNRPPNLREIITEEMKEQQQIDLVKKNLVMTGIPESNAADAMQKAKDIILRDLNITAEISKVERCGKENPNATRPRLLKLFFNTVENRKNILRNATKLRESADAHTADNVYINPDLTWKQQQAAKNLKGQLDQRRIDEPTKTFKIKKGAIIEIL